MNLLLWKTQLSVILKLTAITISFLVAWNGPIFPQTLLALPIIFSFLYLFFLLNKPALIYRSWLLTLVQRQIQPILLVNRLGQLEWVHPGYQIHFLLGQGFLIKSPQMLNISWIIFQFFQIWTFLGNFPHGFMVLFHLSRLVEPVFEKLLWPVVKVLYIEPSSLRVLYFGRVFSQYFDRILKTFLNQRRRGRRIDFLRQIFLHLLHFFLDYWHTIPIFHIPRPCLIIIKKTVCIISR